MITDLGDDLKNLCKGLAKLFVVDISLSRDQDNPQLIFESMNSTGRELTQADLIRNFVLLGYVAGPGSDQPCATDLPRLGGIEDIQAVCLAEDVQEVVRGEDGEMLLENVPRLQTTVEAITFAYIEGSEFSPAN